MTFVEYYEGSGLIHVTALGSQMKNGDIIFPVKNNILQTASMTCYSCFVTVDLP